MIKTAEISPCERYRFLLTRVWDESRPLLPICGLNPSDADAEKDDPTITREIGFARTWGYGGFWKVNLFAWRSPKPEALRKAIDPVGAGNDYWILQAAQKGERVLCAWGNGGSLGSRASWVYHKILRPFRLVCLGTNQDGSPIHPLYIKGDRQPRTFVWKAA